MSENTENNNIINTNNNNELNQFKNEVYKLLRDQESKFLAQINNQQSKIESDFSIFSKKINELVESNKTMLLSIVTQKIKCERIEELETFKNKVDNMLITHEIRINNSVDEIDKMRLKYDKKITENLLLSGYIGQSCQFPNVSAYLSYNINEVSKLKNENIILKKENKEVKTKIESLLKSMISLCDNSVLRCKEYTDTKQNIFENKLETNLKEFNEKFLDMRSNIFQFQEETDTKIKDIKNDYETLYNMKNEFINLIDKKFAEFKKISENLHKKIVFNIQDIAINKNKIITVDNHTKQIDLNIRDLAFKMRNYYTTSNKIACAFQSIGVNINDSKDIANFLRYLARKADSQKLNSFQKLPVKRGSVAFSPSLLQKINNNILTNNTIVKNIRRNSVSVKKVNNNENNKKNNNKNNSIKNIIKLNTFSDDKDDSINISSDSSSMSKSDSKKQININSIDTPQNINSNLMQKTLEKTENEIDTKKIKNYKKDVITCRNKQMNDRMISTDPTENTPYYMRTTPTYDKINIKSKNNNNKILEDVDKCKLLKINLKDDNVTQTNDDCLKKTMMNKLMKKDKSGLLKFKNNKLDLNSCFLNEMDKFITKKNQCKKMGMIEELIDLPKKYTKVFGRTMYTFYYNKSCKNNKVRNYNSTDLKNSETEINGYNNK